MRPRVSVAWKTTSDILGYESHFNTEANSWMQTRDSEIQGLRNRLSQTELGASQVQAQAAHTENALLNQRTELFSLQQSLRASQAASSLAQNELQDGMHRMNARVASVEMESSCRKT